jgi:hypothetical protein
MLNPFWRDILVSSILIALSIVLYHRVNVEFTGLDDTLIIDSQWDKMKDSDYAFQAFKQSVFIFQGSTYYRPLLIVGLMPPALVLQSENPELEYYLAYSIFWLILTALTIYFSTAILGFSRLFRFLLTLFIVIHPSMVVGVRWIPGIGDLMLTTLALWSLYFFILWRRNKKIHALILHLTFWLSATLVKEAGILLPPLFVLMSILLEDFKKESSVWVMRKTPMLVLLDQLHVKVWVWIKENRVVSALWIILLLAWIFVRGQAGGAGSVSILSYVNNIPYGAKDLAFLVGSILIPLKTAPLISVDWITFLLSIPGILLLFFLTWKYRLSNEVFLVFILWIIFALITSTISGYVILHRLIFPMVGLAFGFAFLNDLLKSQRNLVVISSIVIFTLFGFLNIEFQKDYNSAESFWTAIRDRSNLPSYGLTGLGNLYQTKNKPVQAKEMYIEALKHDELAPFMYVNLGRAYLDLDVYDSAIYYIQKELDSDTKIFREYVHFARGCALIEGGQRERGIEELLLGNTYYHQSRYARQAYDSLEQELDVELVDRKRP